MGTNGTSDYFKSQLMKLGPDKAPEELVQCCLFLLKQGQDLANQTTRHTKTRHDVYQKYAVLDAVIEKVGKARLTKEELAGFGKTLLTAQSCIMSHYRIIYGRGNVMTRTRKDDGSLSIVVMQEGTANGTAQKGA